MASDLLQERVRGYESYIKKNGYDEKVIDAYYQAVGVAFAEGDDAYALNLCKRAKMAINTYCLQGTNGGDIWALEKHGQKKKIKYPLVEKNYAILLEEAKRKRLDSYFLYLERNRDWNDRFYLPRRGCFLQMGLIQALQDMIDDKLDILSISLVPGSGKTTLSKFFVSGIMGWFPKDYSLFYSHSGDITRMYYDGVLSILTDKEDYTWNEIFPKLKVSSTNARMEQINVGKYKPFPSLQTTTLDSRNAGKVRASKFLMTDDLVSNIEEALNKNALEKIWNKYAVDARQRKTQDTEGKTCKEVMIMTRWSVHDPIGHLQKIYDGDDRVRFISVPDIDPITGDSNFEYEIGGFTTEFFHDQEKVMDEISYKCLYKQEPVEREGLLYHETDLRRFDSLPISDDGSDREPDAILAICDTKTTGTDYMFLPVVYQYDNDYYLVDCVCNNSTNIDALETRMADMISAHKVQSVEVESNAGGAVIASNVEKKVASYGWSCSITTKATETNKETRIIVNADWVKNHILFKNKELYSTNDDYGTMMSQLLSYTVAGKNKHDDVCDGLSNFAIFVNRKFGRPSMRIIRGGLL